MDDLSDRVIVVTGGAGALGSAIVARLSHAGAICVVPTLPEESIPDELDAEIVANTDLAEPDSVAAVYDHARDLGRVWGSIHAAGGFAMGAIDEADPDIFERMMRMNGMTCYLCCREAMRAMDRGGRIVNVCARPGLSPDQGAQMVAYAASKAAVGAMTRALASEAGPRGVLVNAVVPSIIDTPTNRRAMPEADHGKWPKPQQIAEVVAQLVSPEIDLLSGALVPVYGLV